MPEKAAMDKDRSERADALIARMKKARAGSRSEATHADEDAAPRARPPRRSGRAVLMSLARRLGI